MELSADAPTKPEPTTEGLTNRLTQLRAEQNEDTWREQAASDEARAAMVSGTGDPDESTRRLTEIQNRLRVRAEAIAEIERTLPAVRFNEARVEAERRVLGVHRGVTSVIHAAEQDALRLQECVAEAVALLQRRNARQPDIDARFAELLVLHYVFDLPVPDIEYPAPPAHDTRLVDAVKALHAVTLAEGSPPPRSLTQVPVRGTAWSLRNILKRIADTPTADLLQVIGYDFGNETSWEARRTTQQNAYRDRQDAARRARIAKVNAWLRDQLAKGPRLVEVIEKEAGEAGIFPHRHHNRPGESLREAADRLGVVGVTDGKSGPVLWALTGTFDDDRYRPLGSNRATLAGLR